MRGLTPELLNGLEKGIFYPVSLIDVEWSDGNHYYYHSGIGDLTWDGKVWAGLCQMTPDGLTSVASFDLPPEDAGIAQADASLILVGTIESLLSTQSEYQRGLEFQFYFGAVTEPAGTTLVGEPFPTFTGITNGNRLGQKGEGLVLQISSGVPARAAASIAHSTEDQQAQYPGDTFFDAFAVAEKWQQKGSKWGE